VGWSAGTLDSIRITPTGHGQPSNPLFSQLKTNKMSYEKAMKWNRKHPKGTKQPILMHTESGFTPSESFLVKYFNYRGIAENLGLTPIDCEQYYNLSNTDRSNLITTSLKTN
jgi:hypothetical protein